MITILLDTSNNPIQENINLRTSWLDIVTSTGTYKAVFSSVNTAKSSWIITWTWIVLSQSNPTASCKRILESWLWNTSWTYTINPAWTSLSVYCDMITKWWWWTKTHLLYYLALPSSNDLVWYKGMFNTTRSFWINGYTTDITKITFDEFIYITDDNRSNIETLNPTDIYDSMI